MTPSVTPDLINWVKDFLSERSLRVVVDGCSLKPMTTNAGVTQGSVLSVTLFLLHINDLLMPGFYGYTDDSKVIDRCLPTARVSKDLIQSEKEAMLERTNVSLKAMPKWGEANLVGFNATITSVSVHRQKEPVHLGPALQNVSLE